MIIGKGHTHDEVHIIINDNHSLSFEEETRQVISEVQDMSSSFKHRNISIYSK